jgi:hypothetical protein
VVTGRVGRQGASSADHGHRCPRRGSPASDTPICPTDRGYAPTRPELRPRRCATLAIGSYADVDVTGETTIQRTEARPSARGRGLLSRPPPAGVGGQRADLSNAHVFSPADIPCPVVPLTCLVNRQSQTRRPSHEPSQLRRRPCPGHSSRVLCDDAAAASAGVVVVQSDYKSTIVSLSIRLPGVRVRINSGSVPQLTTTLGHVVADQAQLGNGSCSSIEQHGPHPGRIEDLRRVQLNVGDDTPTRRTSPVSAHKAYVTLRRRRAICWSSILRRPNPRTWICGRRPSGRCGAAVA